MKSNILTLLTEFLQEAKKLSKKPLVALIGPTASGKTALSLMIAEKFNGEVISADSRQVYKYMDIGTEKILPSHMKGIPHHLLDVVEPPEEFNLSDYKRLATIAITDILKRGKLPILCGGTGLYINAVIQNYEIPKVPPNPKLREELEKFARTQGATALHELLQKKDHASASHIHPNNVRYVIRALEILEAGKKKEPQKGESLYHVFSAGINWPREKLYERINKRVEDQLKRGLLDEIKFLLDKGYDEKLPSMSSLGYLEMIPYIKGKITLEEAMRAIQQNTRHYAKRQITWFRKYKEAHWLEPKDMEELVKLTEKISG